MKRLLQYVLLFFMSSLLICHTTYAADGDRDPDFLSGINGANGDIYTTILQPDGKIIIGGDFTIYGGINSRNHIARLNVDGSLDMSFDPGSGANDYVRIAAVQSDGKIIIGGNFTTYNGIGSNRIIRLNADGSLDSSFTIGTGANNSVTEISFQSDGKIVIGGNFTTYNGISRSRIARLNTDGTLDASFNPGTGFNASVAGVDIQSDGKIVVGGVFTSYNSIGQNRIARLNADGSLDTSFIVGTGADSSVLATGMQTDGKIIIAGRFASYNGISINDVARLNTDGSLDTSFDPGTGTTGDVEQVNMQTDGKIVISGYFSTYNGTARKYIARLNSDGSVDASFDPGTGIGGENLIIFSTAIQTDNKIVIGGSFDNYGGVSRNHIARLNADGILDNVFNIGNGAGTSGDVRGTATQSDGKVVIVGNFDSYNGVNSNYIARINVDGTLDTTFDVGAGANNYIYDVGIQSDGKVIIAGSFSAYNGTAINRIARLNTDGSLDTTFNSGSAANNVIFAIDIQQNDKIIIGGNFTAYNGTTRNRIAQLNVDGTLDANFSTGAGANNSIYNIGVQSDGKIIIAGNFTAYNGTTRNRIARVNVDGTLDTEFTVGTGANNIIYTTIIQPDDKIVIGGNFTTYNGTTRNRIARLDANGTLDAAFTIGTGANNYVYDMDIQFDNKIVIGGNFTTYNGIMRNYIARLNTDGTLDTSFDPGSGADSEVSSIELQSDGKIMAGGWFEIYDNTHAEYVTRILSDFQTISPTVFTGRVSNNADASATMEGIITGTGGENPERIIEWGTESSNYNNFCTAGVGGIGGYACSMTGLTLNDTYFIRAKATNSIGTSYGQEITYTHFESLAETIVPNEFIGGGVSQGWQDDEMTWAYTLPFDFSFYGELYVAGTSIGITSNGQICLEDDSTCVDYENNITSQLHGPFIAPLWTDLNSTNTGGIFITETPEYIVIRWETEEYDVPGEVLNFEVVLYSNGNIKFNYDTQTAPLENVVATVGISKGDGTYVASIYDGHTDFNQIDTSAWGDFNAGGSAAQTHSQSLSATIQENLTLTCGGDIDLDNNTTLIPGIPQSNITTCTVTTNDAEGYDLQLTDDRGSNNTLQHTIHGTTTDGQIQDKTPWNLTSPNATSYTGEGLAFGILNSTATKNTTWWGTGNTCDDTNQFYAGIPQTDTTIMGHTTYSNTQTDTEICYRINVPSTQISGEYTGSVTYTATGRP